MTRRRILIPSLFAGLLLTAATADAQGRASWTSDRRDFVEGDVITVLIDEYTLAASNQGNFSSDRRFLDMGLGVDQTMSPAAPAIGVDVNSSSQGESRKQADATRQNRFQGEMTVRVIGIEEGGLLRVEGKKVVNIDKTSEELTLRGLVRPQDVSSANIVESWRVGEAELLYASKQPSSRGFFGRLLGAIWP
jgi:flagellar L-ring protein FlgH